MRIDLTNALFIFTLIHHFFALLAAHVDMLSFKIKNAETGSTPRLLTRKPRAYLITEIDFKRRSVSSNRILYDALELLPRNSLNHSIDSYCYAEPIL